MPGPTHPWDQSGDPRESTVDLPRIDLANMPGYLPEPTHPAERRTSADVWTPDGAGLAVRRPTGPTPRPEAGPIPRPEADPIPRQPPDGEEPLPPKRIAAQEPVLPPDTPPVPDGSGQPALDIREVQTARSNAGQAPAGRPAPGSLADLRSRLARLPDGHPSSPYDDGGEARPLPTRLKQLELGLPAPERHPGAGTGSAAERDWSGDRSSATAGSSVWPEATAEDGRAVLSTPRRPSAEAADAHRTQTPRPAAALEAGQVRTGPAPDDVSPARPAQDRNGGRQRPARPQWQDPYAIPSSNGHSQHHAEAERRDDLALPRWPAARPTAGAGNGDQPRAQTGQLTAEQRELARRVLARCRVAEGRNALGGYGNSGLTPAIQRIAAQLPHGGLAPRTEADSLKSADRFAAKLARLIARNPGRPAEELALAIYDAVRYAFTFEPASYTEGTWLVHRKLKAQGFELEARRNRWESPEYKGIWTRWRDPAHDLAFEVQFHTTASWAVLKRTHEAYVRITDPATQPPERARLRARQVAAAAEVNPPPHCMEIADFHPEAR